MNKTQRIFSFIFYLLILILVWNIGIEKIEHSIEVSQYLFISLFMVGFSIFFIEHFFTKQTDVIANSIAILFVLLEVNDFQEKFQNWYWILLVLVISCLISAIISLHLFTPNESKLTKKNIYSRKLKNFAKWGGNGKSLFSILSILLLLSYFDTQSNFVVLLIFYIILLWKVDTKKPINWFEIKNNSQKNIAEIISVSSENLFLAKIKKGGGLINKFDAVNFNYSMKENNNLGVGIIIDKYYLEDNLWLKILQVENENLGNKKINTNDVHPIIGKTVKDYIPNIVGLIVENSTIDQIKFEYISQNIIEEGQILEVPVGDEKVLYQVVQGNTKIEQIEGNNESDFILGEAVQLGIWKKDSQEFQKYGWVPSVNSLVNLVKTFDVPAIKKGEIELGGLPGTDIPIYANIQKSINRHLAILGVTGTGKSFLARYFIKEAVKEGIKVICVDFTGEYAKKLQINNIKSIISKEEEQILHRKIVIRLKELEKFPGKGEGKRNEKTIKECETEIKKIFRKNINVILNSSDNLFLLELPGVSNTEANLDYTAWFFNLLFLKRQKENDIEQKNQICVVLEEAHTIVPEWNFLGVTSKKGQALTNVMNQIALQGRKFKIGFMIIAQRTASVSKTILTQCNTIISFKQFDKTSISFLSVYFGDMMGKSLKGLKTQHAVVSGEGLKSGVPLVVNIRDIAEEETDAEEETEEDDGWD